MADKIVILEDSEGNNIYPISRGLATNSVDTNAIQNGAVTSAKIDSTTLYEYTGTGHGEDGNLTLTAPFSDFQYVDVFAENLDGGITSTRVLGSATISYINVIDYYNNAIYLKTAQFRVSGTSFTWHHNNYQMKITSAGAVEITSNAKWGILKIVGYK